MHAWVWVLIVVAVALAIGVAVLMALRQRRSERLRQGFGPEYERVVERAGDRGEAEAELARRAKRREELDIRPLSPQARAAYEHSWHATQSRFVDQPAEAVAEAERSVTDVMRERGYPVDDFDQRAADVSVDHPVVVENYRAAHAISTRAVAGEATTEDLRQAMKHYRALFEELLDSTPRAGNGGPERQTERTEEVGR